MSTLCLFCELTFVALVIQIAPIIYYFHVRNDPVFVRFVERQRRVDAHVEMRSAWECQGNCGQCQVEYKVMPKGKQWTKEYSRYGCEIKCNLDVSFESTMENTGCWRGDAGKICGNTRRNSDVHMQYYSWEDTDFMRPALGWDLKTSFISSFISNCGGGDRLEWMARIKSQLAKHNESRVFNYGGCNRDTQEDLGMGRGRSKDIVAQVNRFVFSFENSQTEDYVTEKLFDMLSSGAIPVYRGATNARVYAPAVKSVVFADDYGSPEELAKALLAIDRNEYDKYMNWKTKGPDLKWIALVDEGIVHSQCRACMHYAEYELDNQTRWWIRERGSFYYLALGDAFDSWDLVRYTISNMFGRDHSSVNNSKPFGSGAVVHMYRALDRNRCELKSLDDMRLLRWGEKLEVVLENPGWLKRKHFVDWWQRNGEPTVK